MIEGDAVVHELVLPVSAEQAFDMFTDPGQLVRWIGISADLDARPGGQFRFEIIPGQFCEGEYVIVDRPRRLVLTWGWTDPGFGLPPGGSRVEVTFTPCPDDARRTRLRLVHDGLSPDLGLLHDDGWSRFFHRLTAALTGQAPAGQAPAGQAPAGQAPAGQAPAGQAPAAYPDEQPDQRLAVLRRQHGVHDT